MRHAVTRHLLYPIHESLKGQRTVARFNELCTHEHWPAERLREFQTSTMRRLVAHAAQAPYYAERFASAGIGSGDFRNLEDIRQLPFLTKDDIRANREQMVAFPPNQRRRLVPFLTGGSTGEPVKFYVDRGRISNEWGACWRARSWWGLDWGDRWFWLWGSPIELTAQDRVKNLRDWLLNRRILSAFDLTEKSMGEYVRLIRRYHPRYIYAYASAAYLLAEFILSRGLDAGDATRVVFTTADTLHPHMRSAISTAFKCPAAIEYGSRDGGFIAHECPDGGLHIHADRIYLEIVNGNEPVADGELGEIVLTNLDAWGMPFLRYRTGDVGALDPQSCKCGRVLPLLKTITGRSSDFLLARGDRLIHGESITHVIRRLDGVSRFRVFQEDMEHLLLEIVPTSPRVELPVERMRSQIQHLFGYPVSVEINILESLPPTPSGKYRVVTSKLTGRYFEHKHQRSDSVEPVESGTPHA